MIRAGLVRRHRQLPPFEPFAQQYDTDNGQKKHPEYPREQAHAAFDAFDRLEARRADVFEAFRAQRRAEEVFRALVAQVIPAAVALRRRFAFGMIVAAQIGVELLCQELRPPALSISDCNEDRRGIRARWARTDAIRPYDPPFAVGYSALHIRYCLVSCESKTPERPFGLVPALFLLSRLAAVD